jgi:hypothetical protein
VRESGRGEKDDLEAALANTVESWKRALLISAKGSGERERWIIGLASASLVVGLAALIVALVN